MNYVGIGTRVLNFIIDTLLIFGISWVCNYASNFHSYYYHTDGWPFYYFFWLVMVLYYLFFEQFFARTPAKWLTMSKVVAENGKRPAFWQILVRSLLRLTLIVDCVCIAFTERTLHDYVTKTAVVEA